MTAPEQLTIENFSKAFMTLAKERYPTSERILKLAGDLGIEKDEVEAKILLFTQFRDMIKAVDPERIFETLQHRDEIYEAILDTLEELEEQLEDLEAEEEEYEFLEYESEEEELAIEGVAEGEEGEEEEEEESLGFWDIETE